MEEEKFVVESQSSKIETSFGQQFSLEFPRDLQGRIKWRELQQDPQRLDSVVEAEARRLLEPISKPPNNLIN